MKEMCLTHNNYNRIVDKVLWLGYGAVLNFNVDLYHIKKDYKSNDKIEENFHKEILYKDNKNNQYKVKVIREFNYYFSIELNTKDYKAKVNIGPNEIYFVIFNLNNVMKWFIGDNGINNIFKEKNSRIIIPTHPDPIKISLAYDSYIEFEPAVNSSDGYDVIGTNVYLNSDSVFFFMPSNSVFSLYNMLSTCNMYTLAQNMLNYINRPECGTNLYNMETREYTENKYNNKSFFNMVGAKQKNE